MHQKKNRKKELIRRTLVYSLMTATVIISLSAIMFHMQGYRFDLYTRTVQQTGLVQYDSFPRGASVYADNIFLNKTQTKSTATPGQHQFSMNLDGYESWQKTLDIRSNTVTQLDYARLVPSERKIAEVKQFDNIQAMSFSNGGSFMVGINADNNESPVAIWGDLRDEKNSKFVEHPLSVTNFAGYDNSKDTRHRFSVAEWDLDERYVLCKHIYTSENNSENVQWFRLDRENPSKVINISNAIGADIKITDMHIAGTNGNDFYFLQDNGDLRYISRLDSDRVSVSRPIISKVEDFHLYSVHTVSYVAKVNNTKVAGVWQKGWREPIVVRQFTAEESLHTVRIAVSRYFNEDTIVVSCGSGAAVYRGALPSSNEALNTLLKTSRKMSLGRDIGEISISNSGRFVIARDNVGFVSYDSERDSVSQNVTLRGSKKVKWLDDFHIWHTDEKGYMLMQEFDGTNSHQLLPMTSGQQATLSSDNKSVYAIGVKAGKTTLYRLNMIVEN